MGVIHGDVRPENIMFTSDMKKMVFIDFGLARNVNEKKGWGTRLFMSPELRFTDNFGELENETWGFGISVCSFLFGENFYSYGGYKMINNDVPVSSKVEDKVTYFINIITKNFKDFFENKKNKWIRDCGSDAVIILSDAFTEIFKEQSSRISLPQFIDRIDSFLSFCTNFQNKNSQAGLQTQKKDMQIGHLSSPDFKNTINFKLKETKYDTIEQDLQVSEATDEGYI